MVIDHVAPVTRLLEKRRQMFEVQEALEAQKEEFARREENARRREEGLRRKDLDLQTSLINYNKTIMANESKRQRSLQRKLQEEKLLSLREEQIREKTAELQTQEDELESHMKSISKVRKYRDYLQSVQEAHSDEFSDIGGIERRFVQLRHSNAQLQAQSQLLVEELRAERKRLEEARAREVNERLTQTIAASALTSEFEVLTDATEALSKREAEVAVGDHKRVSEYGVVLASVANLFGRASRSNCGQRIRHFDSEISAKEVQTVAETAALRESITLDEVDRYLGRSGGGDAASPPVGTDVTGAPVFTSATAAEPAPVAVVDPLTVAAKRRAATVVEMERATTVAELRLEAVGQWVLDFEEIVRAWRRDKTQVQAKMLEERTGTGVVAAVTVIPSTTVGGGAEAVAASKSLATTIPSDSASVSSRLASARGMEPGGVRMTMGKPPKGGGASGNVYFVKMTASGGEGVSGFHSAAASGRASVSMSSSHY
jgi:hypothetical protein